MAQAIRHEVFRAARPGVAKTTFPTRLILEAFLVLDDCRVVGPFVLQKLCASGVLLTGRTAVAVGTRVRVQLRWRSGRGPLEVPAIVVCAANASTERFTLAVTFRDVSAANEDVIQNAALQALEEARVHSVLVFDECSEDRQALGPVLVGLGQKTFHASTFLDVLRLLHDPYVRIEVALVDRLREARGLSVLGFLAEEFPNVRRVLMSCEADDPCAEEAKSSGGAHAILLKPAGPAELAAAVGLDDEIPQPW